MDDLLSDVGKPPCSSAPKIYLAITTLSERCEDAAVADVIRDSVVAEEEMKVFWRPALTVETENREP